MLAEMKNKRILITGGTGGIGKVTARELAGMGAQVVIVGRSQKKGEHTADELRRSSGNPNIDILVGDLSIQDEVKRVACEYRERYDQLHVLINNAGALFLNRQLSADVLEMSLALNHLAYFALTYELLELLKASAPARVINVSSAAHYGAQIDFNQLGSEKRYMGWITYGRSKLMNVMFTYELARRLEGSGVTVNCLHPGFVATNFGMNNSAIYRPFLSFSHLFAIPPEQGAETSVYLASSPAVEGVSGKYFAQKTAVPSSIASYDKKAWQRLWDVSLELSRLNGYSACPD